jgi:hypothetical protein
VKSNAPNSKLASSLLGNDKQFVPSSEQSEHIESTTNSKLTKDYKCAHCNATGHTYPTCPKKAAAGAGVVKPKDIIVTGDYVVYSLRKHPSDYADTDKPIEVAALSSDQINKQIFRPYNPDGNNKSELSLCTRKYMKEKGVAMNFKDLKNHFNRTQTENSGSKKVFKLDITENNVMFSHVMGWTHENLGHYKRDKPDIDCWEVADSEHCFNFESRLDANYKPTTIGHDIPHQMHLGSPSSLSPTESCILGLLAPVTDATFQSIEMFLEENARNTND